MSPLNKLWFSQAALSAWQGCPLKFKYRYIDGLYWPVVTGGKLSERIEQGRQFHLLAQRYFGGQGRGRPQGPTLATWLARLEQYLPLDSGLTYLPEYELRLASEGFRFLAKYDLVAASPDQVIIYDWKTDERPPSSRLAAAPQTRLYLYLLVRSKFFVEQAEKAQMIYWNPRFPLEPLAIAYSADQLAADAAWLKQMVSAIKDAQDFPATIDQSICQFCEYRPICHGQSLEAVADELLNVEEVDWDQIEEIVLQGVNSH